MFKKKDNSIANIQKAGKKQTSDEATSESIIGTIFSIVFQGKGQRLQGGYGQNRTGNDRKLYQLRVGNFFY